MGPGGSASTDRINPRMPARVDGQASYPGAAVCTRGRRAFTRTAEHPLASVREVGRQRSFDRSPAASRHCGDQLYVATVKHRVKLQ